MLTHRGFSAWIVVDGKPLPEYLVAVDQNQHRVSCWVPSEEGKVCSQLSTEYELVLILLSEIHRCVPGPWRKCGHLLIYHP